MSSTRRLLDRHGREAAGERGVALDLAVLGERGGADHAQLAAREQRLEDVGGVHRALGRARAEHRVQLVDEQDDLALGLDGLVSASFRRFSNWPRNWAPATMPDRSSATIRVPLSVSGTSSRWMRRARPSAIAVLPTPASPISTALFLRRRARISTVCSISSVRPTTGSMRPAAASAVRSRPNSSSADSRFGDWALDLLRARLAQQRRAPVGAGREDHPHRTRPLAAGLAGLGVKNLSHGH